MPTSRPPAELPASILRRAVRAARAIKRQRGVVGVFLGAPRRAGKWQFDDLVLSVHVRRKKAARRLSEAEHVAPRIDGFATDIVEVGAPRAHSLSCDDAVRGDRDRRSTISAIAQVGARAFALVSGHGTLPWGPNGIVREAPAGGVGVDFLDDGQVSVGNLREGGLGNGRPFDFALVEISSSANYDTTHRATGAGAPFLYRSDTPAKGEQVACWSAAWNRHKWVNGRVIGLSVSEVDFELPDSSPTTYRRVLAVAPDGDDLFSHDGDSGTLVVDAQGAVVGTVLGGDKTTSYVLLAKHLENVIDAFPSFFRKA